MWDPKKEKGIWSEFAEDELLENIDPDEDTLPAEDGIRDVERSRGLGDVYKRQPSYLHRLCINLFFAFVPRFLIMFI